VTADRRDREANADMITSLNLQLAGEPSVSQPELADCDVDLFSKPVVAHVFPENGR
jgi:hypothetical protein